MNHLPKLGVVFLQKLPCMQKKRKSCVCIYTYIHTYIYSNTIIPSCNIERILLFSYFFALSLSLKTNGGCRTTRWVLCCYNTPLAGDWREATPTPQGWMWRVCSWILHCWNYLFLQDLFQWPQCSLRFFTSSCLYIYIYSY